MKVVCNLNLTKISIFGYITSEMTLLKDLCRNLKWRATNQFAEPILPFHVGVLLSGLVHRAKHV